MSSKQTWCSTQKFA
uniref:Uncharacterized protein n=1 Tax=Rhizophora mucronata TaxID=61149 RepID=A0A2P2R2K9_RHIMU